jgi:hypothetical protein
MLSPRIKSVYPRVRLGAFLLGIFLTGILLFTVSGCQPPSPQPIGTPPPASGPRPTPVPTGPTPLPAEPGSPPTPVPTGLPEGSPKPGPPPTSTPTVAPNDSELDAFDRACEIDVHAWRSGQVDYPQEITVPLHESVPYEAAVDVRTDPLPADKVIDAGNGAPGSEPIFVQCRIAARLTAVGDGVSVIDDPENEVGGWVYQKFTPLGVVKWSWSIKADKPKDQQLRLELRPATLTRGTPNSPDADFSGNQVPFVTHVAVDATLIQKLSYWFETQWPLLAGIAATLGVAALAVKKWLGDFIGESRKKQNKKPKSA